MYMFKRTISFCILSVLAVKWKNGSLFISHHVQKVISSFPIFYKESIDNVLLYNMGYFSLNMPHMGKIELRKENMSPT